MPTLDGAHSTGSGERTVRYHVDYEVVGNVVNYKATFENATGPASHEGQFDFDPRRVDAKAAVDAFMQNHIGKDDFDVAP